MLGYQVVVIQKPKPLLRGGGSRLSRSRCLPSPTEALWRSRCRLVACLYRSRREARNFQISWKLSFALPLVQVPCFVCSKLPKKFVLNFVGHILAVVGADDLNHHPLLIFECQHDIKKTFLEVVALCVTDQPPALTLYVKTPRLRVVREIPFGNSFCAFIFTSHHISSLWFTVLHSCSFRSHSFVMYLET